MRSSSQAELEAYIRSKEPMDKAGAYAIQGKGAEFIYYRLLFLSL